VSVSEEDTKLAADIRAAVEAYDAADAARKEKAIIAGTLLAKAEKRHPTPKAFEKFLEAAGGIQIRRAQNLIAIALGRKDFEQHQADNKAAQQRHRDKLRAEKISRDRAKAEEERAKAAKAKPEPALRNAGSAETSAANLNQFEAACRSYLPRLNEADLTKAQAFVAFGIWQSQSRKAA